MKRRNKCHINKNKMLKKIDFSFLITINEIVLKAITNSTSMGVIQCNQQESHNLRLTPEVWLDESSERGSEEKLSHESLQGSDSSRV